MKTDTFVADPADPAERGGAAKIFGSSRRGAEPARETVDGHDGGVVPGSAGADVERRTSGHSPYVILGDAYVEQVKHSVINEGRT